MPRNLDMTALRSFVTVAQAGGVTRAAGFLNLTQSAVSMQLKRLEESMNLQLMDRSARTIALTAAGEQLLGYARRMLDLNDEALARLTHQEFEGTILLGVPNDIVYPAIPEVLNRFNCEFPRVKVQLISSYTNELKALFASGECDMILTTEDAVEPGGETLVTIPLRWNGAPGGKAWRQRPLRVAFCQHCRFRTGSLRALDQAGIPWEMAIESGSDRAIEATISADLAVGAMLEGTEPQQLEQIQHCGALPDLAEQQINLYAVEDRSAPAKRQLIDMIRQGYGVLSTPKVLKFG
ncbi:MAG: LysR family transcriptional regulator [Rhodobacter sp.]|nr:LysR family transcriptional regulator [Rhodobacter sp.]